MSTTEDRARSFTRRTGRPAFVVFAVSEGGHRTPMCWRANAAEAEKRRAEVARVSMDPARNALFAGVMLPTVAVVVEAA